MNAKYSSGLPSRGEICLPEPEHLPGKVLADRPHAPSKPEASAKPTVTTDAGYAPIMAAVDMYTEAQILKHIHQLQRPHRPLHFTVAPGCEYIHSNGIHSHTARHHPIRDAEPPANTLRRARTIHKDLARCSRPPAPKEAARHAAAQQHAGSSKSPYTLQYSSSLQNQLE